MIREVFMRISNRNMQLVNGGGKKQVHAELFIDSNVVSLTALEKRPPIYELPVVRPVKL